MADPGRGPAATKLRPPVPPPELIRRTRLDDLLDDCVERHVRLVLASAPAGSGKSTLLASWAAGRSEALVWLQVEDSDGDPARFWSFLVDAVGNAHPAISESLHPVVAGSQGDELVVVAALVNALATLTDRVVLVIDDYHLIANTDVHRGVERLVELCPEQLTIVISTRIDPPFRLGRLRVRNHICEIRAADLRFDAGDASALLGRAGDELDSLHLQRLCDRTEGWAAGLVLAGLSLLRSADPNGFVDAFGGDDQLVVDFLGDELLDGLDDADLRRLLETSILDQLSGDLVDAVTASTGGAVWLADMASHNQLLIRLDRTGSWYRYHHLLRDLLRLEAQRVLPERLPEMHGRAAAWFESGGDDHLAVTHRLIAGDLRSATRILHRYGIRLLRSGQIETLRALLEQIGEAGRTSAICAFLHGWCEFMAGRYSSAEAWLGIVAEVAPATFDHGVTTALRMNISLARGDVATALDVAREMTAADRLIAYPSDLANAAGAAYAWAGRFDDARTTLRLAAEKATTDPSHAGHVLALVYRSIVEFEDSTPAAAHAAAVAAIDIATGFGLAGYHGVAPAFAIRGRTEPDPVLARASAMHALVLARRSSTDLSLGYVLAMCGDTLLDLHDSGGAPLVAEAGSVIARCVDPGIVGSYLNRVESRHHLVGATPRRAAPLVDPLTEREIAVLRHLPTQLSQRRIAAEMYVSLNTVKTHCSAIFRKLGVGDRAAAVQAARDAGLL